MTSYPCCRLAYDFACYYFLSYPFKYEKNSVTENKYWKILVAGKPNLLLSDYVFFSFGWYPIKFVYVYESEVYVYSNIYISCFYIRERLRKMVLVNMV